MAHDKAPITIATVFGTRPEAVKLAPVIRRLAKDPRFLLRVVVTGQHREMLEEILGPFGIVPDADLAIMQPGQTLNDIVCRAMPSIDRLYREERPDVVLVQGDTTSAFCAALAAFDRRIPVAHVEAGLRSFDRFQPYPEEANRRMLSVVADLHFAPTSWALGNLTREGTERSRVVVTGNTVVDALLMVLGPEAEPASAREKTVLITLHRRESWETPGEHGADTVLDGILAGIRASAERHPEVRFVYPVHLNPNVRAAAHRWLGASPNIALVDPLAYVPFVQAMARASAIVTDSGGVQEEAPSLGVPVLVLRRTTERPEAVDAGHNVLVGTSAQEIERALAAVLDGAAKRKGAPRQWPCPNPFGDGRAAERIVQALLHFRGEGDAPEEFRAENSAPNGFSSSTQGGPIA
ncbi:MAG TPA: UDP-N-acetylglucosamine 2-epimerase (non-hydrolyzing) [Polyangiaceae bacterium]|nr:UDP-N-acetylglucosamine 2-epimerase (non-hydrolyzing) [Polyangiaceae bacterium]